MPEPEVEYITFAIPDSDGLVASIVLNRPNDLNAITWGMIRLFDEVITRAANDREVRVVFITGKGRAFSAGGDLKNYIELQRDPIRFPQFVSELHTAFGRLRKLRVPVIALVNGVTAAGGLELLLNCDMAIAASSARIGDGHLNYGQMGGGGVLTLLARTVGIKRAIELIMTGELIAAETCAAWGLIGRVVPDDELMAEGLKMAASIARKSAVAVANAKYVINTVWAENSSVEAGLHLELERNSLYCLTSEDAREGLLAFSEKREPRFNGRS